MHDYDHETRRGETFDKCFYILDEDEKPKNLTGLTARGHIRIKKGDPVLVSYFDCTINRSTGCVTYRIPARRTKDIPAGNYEYDVCLYEGSGDSRKVKFYIGGKFKVLKAVTAVI